MVCMGNICRSPMAEAVLRDRLDVVGLGGEITVESSGTGGWHVGDRADPRALAALVRRGLELDHRARQFGSADFARLRLVIALDGDNHRHLQRIAPTADDAASVRLLMDFDPTAEPGTPVPDPYYGGPEDFEHALDLIERACDGMVLQLVQGTLELRV